MIKDKDIKPGSNTEPQEDLQTIKAKKCERTKQDDIIQKEHNFDLICEEYTAKIEVKEKDHKSLGTSQRLQVM